MALPGSDLLAARHRGVRSRLMTLGLDGLVVTNPANIRYLSNHVGTAGTLVLTHSGVHLLIDFRYQESVRATQASAAACPDLRIWNVPASYDEALIDMLAAPDMPATVGVGTVTSTTPIAIVCGAASAAATILARFPDGSCTTVTGGITFNGPTVTSFAPITGSATTPSTITITGSNFAPVGASVAVRFVAGAGTPFAGGTASEITLTGTITAATTITVASPQAVLCGTPSVTVTLSLIFAAGPCATAVPGTLTLNGPTLGPVVPNPVLALAPTPISMAGTNLPPAGTPVILTFTSTSVGTPVVVSRAPLPPALVPPRALRSRTC